MKTIVGFRGGAEVDSRGAELFAQPKDAASSTNNKATYNRLCSQSDIELPLRFFDDLVYAFRTEVLHFRVSQNS
jgi:hypothetical protein